CGLPRVRAGHRGCSREHAEAFSQGGPRVHPPFTSSGQRVHIGDLGSALDTARWWDTTNPDQGDQVDLKRSGALFGLAALATVGLAACSDNNAGSGDTAAQAVDGIECAGDQSLTASGASSQNNAMTIFANSYAVSCDGNTLDYNSNGSGAGVSAFIGGQTDFGGSDSPLEGEEYARAAERCEGPAWNLPAVFGPIAVAYNLDGVDVALSGETLANIFNGTITSWNDPAIAAENEGVELPDQPISVIFRSDESGTTDNFQQYLEAASDGAWTGGAGKQFAGGVGE